MRWLPAIGLWTVVTTGCASLAGLDDYGGARDGDRGGGSPTTTSGGPSTGPGGAGGTAAGTGTGKGGGETGYQAAVTADQPLAYWPMDVIDMGTDASTPDVENDYDLLLASGADETTGLFGTSNGALDLSDGGYLESSDSIFAFNGATHFAIEVWYQHLGGNETVLIQRFGQATNGMYTGYRLRVNATGNLAFERWDASGDSDQALLSPAVTPGEVLHLFARYEGGCMCLFAMGVDGSTRSECVSSTRQIVAQANLRLWMSVPNVSFQLDGILDEAAIYVGPTPLPTPEDIASHHEVAILGTPIDPIVLTSCD